MYEMKKIGINSVWMLLGYAFRAVSVLITSVFVARYLGPKLYGEMNYVFSYVAIFSIFSWGCVGPVLRREFVTKPEQQGVYLGSALVLRLIGVVLAMLILLPMILSADQDRLVGVLILIYSASLFFMVTSIFQVLLEVHLKSKYVTYSEVIQLSAFLLLKLLFVYLKFPLLYFVAIQAIEVLFKSILQFGWLRKLGLLPRIGFSKQIFLFLLRESWPLLMSSGAVMVYQKIDLIMLRNMISSDQVGHYAVATKVTGMMVFVPQILHNSLFPAITRAKLKSQKQLNVIITHFFTLMFWVMSGMAVLIMFLIPIPFGWLYGEEYGAALPVINILVWKNVIMGVGLVSGAWIINMGIQKYAPLRSITSMMINIVLNWYLIPTYGGIGAAVASLVASIVNVILISMIIPSYRQVVLLMVDGVFLKLFIRKLKRN